MKLSNAALAFSLLASALALTAQAESSPADAGGWEIYKSVYEVPVQESLKPLATFQLDGARLRDRDGKTQLKYNLPQELTGRPIEVRFVGTLDSKGNGNLVGPNGSADCKLAACAMRYTGLNIQPEQVRDLLVNRGIGGAELAARLEVAGSFRSGDPAGILHIQGYSNY